MSQTQDLAARVARPIWFLVRLLAWDPETWRKLVPDPAQAGGPAGVKPPPPPPPPRPRVKGNPYNQWGDCKDDTGKVTCCVAVDDLTLLEELMWIMNQAQKVGLLEEGWTLGDPVEVTWVLSSEAFSRVQRTRDRWGSHIWVPDLSAPPNGSGTLLGLPVRVIPGYTEPWAIIGKTKKNTVAHVEGEHR